MRKTILFTIIITTIISCANNENKTNEPNKFEARKGTFYKNKLDSLNAIVLADTIRYNVTIKNPDPEDVWTEADICRMDELALANIIFNAIYNKRLTAYDFFEETPMSIEQVKELEKEHPRSTVGKMQFVEEWYFDEENLQFGKKINSITLAYEKIEDGKARYIPGVMVFLNKTGKKPVKD